MTTGAQPAAPAGRLAQVRDSRLVRQNLVLFAGGLVAGVGGFVYHAIAGRILGPETYGQVTALVALYAVGTVPYFVIILVCARYAAGLAAAGNRGGIRNLIERTSLLLAVPGGAAVLLIVALAIPASAFLKLSSPVPLVWLGFAVALYWFVAVPRGVLQGTQHFTGLSLNLSMELLVRMVMLVILLEIGLSVTGSVIAILLGVILAYGLGLFSLRGLRAESSVRVRLRTMVGFSLTAAAGTLGVVLLYNVDVLLAKHFLNDHQAGIYGGLNKIGTILYFFTLSVSQVMFPRVVEAVAKNHHPGRMLLLSAGIMCVLGAGALVVFAVVPGLVVGLLFGSRFNDAIPYILLVGLIGLGLSLDNLLVQFFMAVHDRVFVPILAAGCVTEVVLIVLFHDSVGEVVADVLVAMSLLLVALAVRAVILMPRLRPEMVSEEPLDG